MRYRGLAIAFGGVLAVSPDAMLLRWMRSLGASSPDVAVAKYIGVIVCMLLIASVKGLGGARVSAGHFAASACCQLLYQLSFTFSLLLTDAAKALLLISLAPLWAALFGVVVLKESLPTKTIWALVLSILSVLLVLTPQLMDSLFGQRDAAPSVARGSAAGDLLSLCTGVAQGASLTVSRHAALHSPKADLTLATALSSLAAAVVAIELPCYDLSDLQATAT